MFAKERDQHNDLAFSDFTLQNLYKFYYFIASKIPKMRCTSNSKKSQTVEAPNVNKSVSQAEKVVPAGFWHKKRAVSI